MRTVRVVLVGLGNLGRRFCELLVLKASLLGDRYGLCVLIVGAADSGGAAYGAIEGLGCERIAALKREGKSIAEYPDKGRAGWGAQSLVAEADAEVLVEASPVNLAGNAEPGLACIRGALRRGMHVVTANKGPLVLAFDELQRLAAEAQVQLRFDATVAGGLPALAIGTRDLCGATLQGLEAVPNLSTGVILSLVGGGASWVEAIEQVESQGTLEGDGRWDLDGWDAAAKLVILANTVLGQPARLADVNVRGIRGLDPTDIRAQASLRRPYRLVATATRRAGGDYSLGVEPVKLDLDHPLSRLGPYEMGVLYHTDIYGSICVTIREPDPMPSAAAMLRDLLKMCVA